MTKFAASLRAYAFLFEIRTFPNMPFGTFIPLFTPSEPDEVLTYSRVE